MESKQQSPPAMQMMQMITGFWISCCIYAAAKLAIADHLKEGTKNAEQLAEATHCDSKSLYRVLRALAAAGLFIESKNNQFELTPVGSTLQSDHPTSMKAMAIAQLGDHYNAWGNLMYSIKTGNPAFEKVEGMPVWKYYETHPEEGINFMKAMTGITNSVIKQVLPSFNFSKFKTIVDIGGGNGALLSAILKTTPSAKGIVFDEEYIAIETKNILMRSGLKDRCTVVAGSFFDFVPKGNDAYIMKMVLHDWNDEQCVLILNNCSQAMHAGSRLLVFEAVIPEGNTAHPGKFMDINMLTMTGGRERTEKEFTELFSKAGLKLHRVIPTQSPMFSILEVVKN
ncbi:MAG: methyltransferase [Bacteroidetes bacterium]|nr:methyltransferase [Bacteroidota bacterium]